MPTVSDAAPATRFRFARFELQLDERRLLVDGKSLALGSHGLDLLAALVARPGRLVSKAELLQAVWGKVVVEENTLQAHVSALRKVLGAEAIATVPGQGYRFALPVESLPAEPLPVASAAAPRHNLPLALTSFIGREREVQQVCRHLARARLLTLTGTGGCGKTRLAVEVAAKVADSYAEGVWLVELAALADPTLLAQTLASALSIEAQPGRDLGETVINKLRVSRLLLVLDNAEHLLEGCAAWTERLLRQCAGLTVLVTSRERLGIDGETAWRVPSLSLPGEQDADNPLASEATRLFIDRARHHRPDFELADDEVSILVSVCHRLDGIALAIELAAAQMRVMSLKALHRGLDDRFRLLTGGSRSVLPRHRTLSALIEWSYERLAPSEQMLLRRAAVFAGGWNLQAAERVCGGDGLVTADIWRLLTALADKNLIVAEAGGEEARFWMLETVRHFALGRLGESGERTWAGDRLVAHVLDLANGLNPSAGEGDVHRALTRVATEDDNVRVALAWCESDPARALVGLRLMGLLSWSWRMRKKLSEGQAWVDRLLTAAGDQPMGEAHAAALQTGGVLAIDDGNHASGIVHLRRAVELWRHLGNRREQARSLGPLGCAAELIGDYASARESYKEVLSIAREIDDPRLIALGLMSLGSVIARMGDPAAGRRVLDEARSVGCAVGPWVEGQVCLHLGMVLHACGELPLARDTLAESAEKLRAFGDVDTCPSALLRLADVCQDLRDLPAARVHLQQSLAHFASREVGDISGPLDCLETCAGLLVELTEPLAAARLWGCAQFHAATKSRISFFWVQSRQQRLQQSARKAVGDDSAFDRAWNEGGTWSLHEAVRYARALL